jgi:hypothetical protein
MPDLPHLNRVDSKFGQYISHGREILAIVLVTARISCSQPEERLREKVGVVVSKSANLLEEVGKIPCLPDSEDRQESTSLLAKIVGPIKAGQHPEGTIIARLDSIPDLGDPLAESVRPFPDCSRIRSGRDIASLFPLLHIAELAIEGIVGVEHI